MQPTFLPWFGFFEMINQADLFVFLDDVQISPKSFEVRNRIPGVSDDSPDIWLTLHELKS